MREIIIDIPLEKQNFDDTLFEYQPFKKARKIPQVYQAKVKSAFVHNFTHSAPIFKPQSPSKKNVVIKNIGNMKLAHLKNALSYTIERSFQEYIDVFGQNSLADVMENVLDNRFDNDELLRGKKRCGIDYLGNLVSVDEILTHWREDFSHSKNINEALHLVFSLNEVKSDSLMDILLESTKATMQSNFSEYKYVLIPHAHQNQPHIHIIINKTNIFTRKKLHFQTKEDCATFYNGLREDFKQNLFVLSSGKLDYTNEVRFDKSFRQEHLDSKIQALDDFNQSQDYESDMAFLKDYKNAIDSVNIKQKFLKSRQNTLQKELKNTSIYLNNVEHKIQQLQSQNKEPSRLKNLRLELLDKLSTLSKDYQQTQAHLGKLKEHLRRFYDWEDTYKRFCKNFTLHNKKKSLVDTFKGYEEYLPSNLVRKLNGFKRDIARFEHILSKDIDKINEGVNAGIMDFNAKSNVFVLAKKLSKLVYYKNIISTIAFDENQSLQENKENVLKSLEDSKQTLLEQIALRLQHIAQDFLESRDSYKEYLQALNMQDKNSLKTLQRLHKKLSFLTKEFGVATQLLQKYAITLPIKELASIQTQASTLSQDFSQLLSDTALNKQTSSLQSQQKQIKPNTLDSTKLANTPHIKTRI